MKNRAAQYFQQLQIDICAKLEEIDGKGRFHEDQWMHPGGDGGGKTQTIELGDVFEKGGVNFSAIQTHHTDKIAKKWTLGRKDCLRPASQLYCILLVRWSRRYRLNAMVLFYGRCNSLSPYFEVGLR